MQIFYSINDLADLYRISFEEICTYPNRFLTAANRSWSGFCFKYDIMSPMSIQSEMKQNRGENNSVLAPMKGRIFGWLSCLQTRSSEQKSYRRLQCWHSLRINHKKNYFVGFFAFFECLGCGKHTQDTETENCSLNATLVDVLIVRLSKNDPYDR